MPAITFDLQNNKQSSVVFSMGQRAKGQELTLTIKSRDGNAVLLEKASGEQSATNFHFALCFQAGYLSTGEAPPTLDMKAVDDIELSEDAHDDWAISTNLTTYPENDKNSACLFILWKGPEKLSFETLTLKLSKIRVQENLPTQNMHTILRVSDKVDKSEGHGTRTVVQLLAIEQALPYDLTDIGDMMSEHFEDKIAEVRGGEDGLISKNDLADSEQDFRERVLESVELLDKLMDDQIDAVDDALVTTDQLMEVLRDHAIPPLQVTVKNGWNFLPANQEETITVQLSPSRKFFDSLPGAPAPQLTMTKDSTIFFTSKNFEITPASFSPELDDNAEQAISDDQPVEISLVLKPKPISSNSGELEVIPLLMENLEIRCQSIYSRQKTTKQKVVKKLVPLALRESIRIGKKVALHNAAGYLQLQGDNEVLVNAMDSTNYESGSILRVVEGLAGPDYLSFMLVDKPHYYLCAQEALNSGKQLLGFLSIEDFQTGETQAVFKEYASFKAIAESAPTAREGNFAFFSFEWFANSAFSLYSQAGQLQIKVREASDRNDQLFKVSKLMNTRGDDETATGDLFETFNLFLPLFSGPLTVGKEESNNLFVSIGNTLKKVNSSSPTDESDFTKGWNDGKLYLNYYSKNDTIIGGSLTIEAGGNNLQLGHKNVALMGGNVNGNLHVDSSSPTDESDFTKDWNNGKLYLNYYSKKNTVINGRGGDVTVGSTNTKLSISGNVLIGASSPLSKLTVKGGGVDSDSYIGLSNTIQNQPPDSIKEYIASAESNTLSLYASGFERIRIGTSISILNANLQIEGIVPVGEDPYQYNKSIYSDIIVQNLVCYGTLIQIDPSTQKGSFTDLRDGRTYPVFQTSNGTIWMTENLDYELDDPQKNKGGIWGSKGYGRLYNWNDVVEACPPGWKLPSAGDWEVLISEFGYRGLTSSNDFNALFGGKYDPRYVGSSIVDRWKKGYYWTSSFPRGGDGDWLIARACIFDSARDSVGIEDVWRSTLLSVRCIKN